MPEFAVEPVMRAKLVPLSKVTLCRNRRQGLGMAQQLRATGGGRLVSAEAGQQQTRTALVVMTNRLAVAGEEMKVTLQWRGVARVVISAGRSAYETRSRYGPRIPPWPSGAAARFAAGQQTMPVVPSLCGAMVE